MNKSKQKLVSGKKIIRILVRKFMKSYILTYTYI